MRKLSVTIITYNEEHTIERCLRSVISFADEIIVVDSFSTDNTVAVCQQYRAQVIRKAFTGYGSQKRTAVESASNDCILSLDADEEVSARLAESIIAVKNNWQAPYYSFNRLNFYCGKPIKHSGWYPDRHIRLFDRQKTNWNQRDVHETVELIPGLKPVHLSGDLNHYTCRTIEEHQQKECRYAQINARILGEKRKKIPAILPFLKGGFRFLKTYVFQCAFLDGYYGWIISKTVAKSSYYKYKWAGMDSCRSDGEK